MNSCQMTIEAGIAIENFRTHNDTSCVLYIRDGLVCCCPTKEATFESPTVLIFSRWQQKFGLTPSGWDMLGTELLNLYNKEVACQAHPKP